MDLTKQIDTVREYLHTRVRDSYHAIHKILVMPTDGDPKEKTDLIAKHLVKCLPANEEERLIAATIGSLNSGDRFEAFNDYVDETRNKHILLVRGIGAATNQALDRPRGHHFEYKNGKVIVNYDPDRRPRSYRRDDADSGSESDGDDRRHSRSYHHSRGRGRGGRGRGRGRGNGRSDYHAPRAVRSEQTTETNNQFDALMEHAKEDNKDKADSKAKAKLIQSGDALTKAMLDAKNKKWADDEGSRSASPDHVDKSDQKDNASKKD
jgi:hypothetical protein